MNSLDHVHIVMSLRKIFLCISIGITHFGPAFALTLPRGAVSETAEIANFDSVVEGSKENLKRAQQDATEYAAGATTLVQALSDTPESGPWKRASRRRKPSKDEEKQPAALITIGESVPPPHDITFKAPEKPQPQEEPRAEELPALPPRGGLINVGARKTHRKRIEAQHENEPVFKQSGDEFELTWEQ
ncbi:hypothetical protein P154DRAFT_56344 [Amniculicola lignicola CBS 123094]|uniref:Uncharacterized protein n=1 Tax=Amniculicola lignicola CBS 123094 TaxID=1392246 RepID=A0A6A5WW01_9PLEO|nr:hypothetical protein P154DRAFT_56344 [Amniculicola lignicola CBS 123094]